ncbi:YhdT family protein [Shewanella sp. 1CM18E]|uniref:DUF997 family protein n=1 Tax=Shewanella sp. 1CM18E TaxID=2929169 RepID=UPI0020BF03D4|nr:DUF997 family protein [Shewanella sp. 1CM18E]MCK8043976.1 YhdT family protein [Shewanella sp. 1CM18E]
MSLLTKTSLTLTFSYFFLWCFGPLVLTDYGDWLGLPLWFWFSCIGAPILVIVSLSFLLTRVAEVVGKDND